MATLSTCQGIMRAATLLALAGVGQCALAASERIMPPGLYRIDMDGVSSGPGNQYSTSSRVDGATGKTVTSSRVGNMSAAQRTYKGDGPVTHCISSVNQWQMPGGPLQCTKQSTRQVGDATEHTASCPTGNVKFTMRRLDENRWEQISEVNMGSANVPPNLMARKPMLEMAAREAKTPEQRAEAARQLAALPALQKQTEDKRGEAAAMMADAMRKSTDPVERESLRKSIAALNGTMQSTHRTRQVWTRIADSCSAPPPK
jgi:hypothetical protein